MFIPWQLLFGTGIILMGFGAAFVGLCVTHEFYFKTYIRFLIFLVISVIITAAGFLLAILSLLL